MELKDVIKIVIIQACQGKIRGKQTKLNKNQNCYKRKNVHLKKLNIVHHNRKL